MQVNIIVFGHLSEIMGTHFMIHDVVDTDSIILVLNKKFPILIDTKYAMALDKKLVITNTILNNNSTIALLPPFSGG